MRFSLLFLFPGLFSLHLKAQYPVPVEGLIAFYELNGNALDSWVNEYHGFAEFAEATADRFGQEGFAMRFDGSSAYIDTNHSFDFPSQSVSLWLKTYDANGYGENAKVPLTQDSYLLDEGLFRVDFTEGDLQLWSGGNASVYTEPAILDEWLHIVMTRTADSVEYYVNGEFVMHGNANSYASSIHPNDHLIIGCGRSLFYQFFNGSVDDVAIYNRKLLRDEVKEIFEYRPTFTHTGSEPPSGLSINWKNQVVEVEHNGQLDGFELELILLNGSNINRLKVEEERNLSLKIPQYESGICVLAIRDKKKRLWYSEKAFLSR